MKRRAFLLALALVLPAAARAQTPAELLTRARAAFDNLDFEQAARLYTRILEPESRATPAQRDTAQLYLGVAFEFAGQRANAVSAFRTVVRGNPCVRTPRDFGDNVTAAFVEARSGIFAAGVCELRTQRLTRSDSLVLEVIVTRPALVRASLQDSAGRPLADMGERTVEGRAEVRWPGVPDPATIGPRPVLVFLAIRARERDGVETDQRSLPVTVYSPIVDTLPHPPPLADSLFLPEFRPRSGALGDLGKGVLFGAVAAAIPAALAYPSLGGETTKALAVGGVMSVTGFVGFVTGSARRAIPGNREFNAELRRQWLARRDSVIAENQARRSARHLVIGPPEEIR